MESFSETERKMWKYLSSPQKYCNYCTSDILNRGIHLGVNAQLQEAILSLIRGMKGFWKSPVNGGISGCTIMFVCKKHLSPHFNILVAILLGTAPACFYLCGWASVCPNSSVVKIVPGKHTVQVKRAGQQEQRCRCTWLRRA